MRYHAEERDLVFDVLHLTMVIREYVQRGVKWTRSKWKRVTRIILQQHCVRRMIAVDISMTQGTRCP